MTGDCPRHPGEAVVGTCSRCGDFVCRQDGPVGGALACRACAERDPPPTWLSPLVREWLVVAGFVLLASLLLVGGEIQQPGSLERGDHPLALAGRFAVAMGQVAWMGMDRKRRGRAVGRWPFAAFLLGPLAIWVYLIGEYRWRSLYLIPLSVCVYFSIAVLPFVYVVARAIFR